MARKKSRPAGPRVLYTQLEECELRDGLVHIAVRSGAHVERGSATWRLVMELYDRLGAVLAQPASLKCMTCARRDA